MHIEVTLAGDKKMIVMLTAIRTIEAYTDQKTPEVKSLISLIGITGQVMYLYVKDTYADLLGMLD
jgi:hypothetical protein